MPTQKPRIQAIVEHKTYEKFKILCQKERRSESNLAGYIITEYIQAYEAEHGQIEIPE